MKKHLNKVVIITGISGGIGQRTANFLYEKGYKIYGIMRGEFSDERFTCYKADVNDYQKIKEIVLNTKKFPTVKQWDKIAKEGGVLSHISLEYMMKTNYLFYC